jgi:RNA polymerase sigma-70 factor (ECF subfamily)
VEIDIHIDEEQRTPARGIAEPLHSDSSLLALVHQGDEQAISRLFDAHSPLVFSIALRVLRDSTPAERILEEVFLDIWRAPEVFRAAGSLPAQLSLLARNKSVAFLKRTRSTCPDHLSPIYRDVSANGANQSSLRQLAPDRVKSEEHLALELAFFGGCTPAEIANRTGSSPEQVKADIGKTLRAIRGESLLMA